MNSVLQSYKTEQESNVIASLTAVLLFPIFFSSFTTLANLIKDMTLLPRLCPVDDTQMQNSILC